MTASKQSTRIALVLVLAVALLAAGCGKSKPKPTPADWASGLCTAITTWKTSLTTTASSLTSGSVSKDSLQSAAGDAKSATDTFISTVKGLGKPNTTSGAQAQKDVDQLATQVQDGMNTIESTLKDASGLSGIIKALPTIQGELQTMQTEVSTTVTNVKQLDASGELTTAFQQASSCKSLTSSSS